MTEDPLDDRGLLDERDRAQAPPTPRTGQDVEPEGPPHQVRPEGLEVLVDDLVEHTPGGTPRFVARGGQGHAPR